MYIIYVFVRTRFHMYRLFVNPRLPSRFLCLYIGSVCTCRSQSTERQREREKRHISRGSIDFQSLVFFASSLSQRLTSPYTSFTDPTLTHTHTHTHTNGYIAFDGSSFGTRIFSFITYIYFLFLLRQ